MALAMIVPALLAMILAPAGFAARAQAPTSNPAPAEPDAATAVKAGVDAWSRRDYAGAVRAWQEPAARGDPDAEFDLAQAYKLGRGVAQDLARAEVLYSQAAAQGHMRAADNYGVLLYQRGAHTEAMPYIQAAAKRGEPLAEYQLGVSYFNGDAVDRDWVRAYALETLAARAGLPQARVALAHMDRYVPLDQRQQGVAMASDMASEAEANRTHALAAADVGIAPGATPNPPLGPPITASPSPRADLQPDSASIAPATAPSSASHAPSSTAPGANNGGWMLQLGAFAVPGNAEALWHRVQPMAGVAGHPCRMVPTGRLTRLMVTGYSEATAKTTCQRLTAAGIACIAARS